MALLERIESMKQAGIPEMQIINSLKEQGISPREIAESLSQARIKSAVAIPAIQSSQDTEGGTEQMQQSIMQNQEQQTAVVNQYSQASQGYGSQLPQNQQYPNQQQQYTQPYNQGQDQQYQNQGQYDQSQDPQYQQQYAQPYDQGQYAQEYTPQGFDIETVRDVAQQEVDEALKKIMPIMDNLTKVKTDIKFEIQNLDNRIQRIELIIQELQTAIIRKMGEYGEAVSSISEELQETQKSFSKMINPILDKQRGTNEKAEEQPEKETQKHHEPESKSRAKSNSKDKANVEDYFR